MDILHILGRTNNLFDRDLSLNENHLFEIINSSSFLVLGGAGSIGQAIVKEIFKRNPKKIHVVDLNENNLAELVRDIRSSIGYIKGEFKTFAIDISSLIFDKFIDKNKYDYVLNLSALKHVRSEKDVFTLMRMIEVNIFNTEKTIEQAIKVNAKKYFCVSTDKAANPVNLMGATKRIMEKLLFQNQDLISVSTARFANVAFSDGSLLYGFNQRILKSQPIVVPNDVKRFFVTPEESGQLCLMSTIFGNHREIFFPKKSQDFQLTSFTYILENYLNSKGLKPHICVSEEEARHSIKTINLKKYWPCYITKSDTTGEKIFEEFFMQSEELDFDRFDGIGIVKSVFENNLNDIEKFKFKIQEIINSNNWFKTEIVDAIKNVLPELEYEDLGKYLDQKM